MNPLTQVRNTIKLTERELELGVSGGSKVSWHAEYAGSAYVYAGGLHFDLTEGDVITVFSQYGEVIDINLVRDKQTGKSKGFAFLGYEDQRSTILAVDNLNGAKVAGRIIRVDHVKSYKHPESEDGKVVDTGCAPQLIMPEEDDTSGHSKKEKKKKEKKKKKEDEGKDRMSGCRHTTGSQLASAEKETSGYSKSELSSADGTHLKSHRSCPRSPDHRKDRDQLQREDNPHWAYSDDVRHERPHYSNFQRETRRDKQRYPRSPPHRQRSRSYSPRWRGCSSSPRRQGRSPSPRRRVCSPSPRSHHQRSRSRSPHWQRRSQSRSSDRRDFHRRYCD